ncbi:hypothetical protein [Nocardia cyriacigeorgica]|uniref:hypothetical protein n=1 Tax=Nocardia cyriacigeorgica TaxID=135487 RepID=UPI000CEA218E|nr:hypothetical protein [Nocardia cyriacigeorgica]AVH20637.1 hypothetical protein C5B73_03255 [Nocardia cyriacigeorgica]MBF6325149.1 hypothetical protein [Nocardia cyriacigeorgica]PPJ02807.1 hypothetical protein C5E43_26000 [Nocardia cyriacigeorgica]
MTQDGKRPMQDIIDAAKDGQVSLSFNESIRVNAEEFVYIERDCEAMKNKIRDLQTLAKDISGRQKWGLGEGVEWIKTGGTLVSWFRGKAEGDPSGNTVYAILERHYQIVDSIQELHRAIAERYQQTDSSFAAEYNQAQASIPHGLQGKK